MVVFVLLTKGGFGMSDMARRMDKPDIVTLWGVFDYLEDNMAGTPLSGHGDTVPPKLVHKMKAVMLHIDPKGEFRGKDRFGREQPI